MKVAVIGSGVAGYSATLALLERGFEVTVIDGGEKLPSDRQATVDQMAKLTPEEWPSELTDLIKANPTMGKKDLPKKMFFGSDFIYAADREFAPTDLRVKGRAPLPNFALGGFSNIWGGSVLPADDCDTADWPVRREELSTYYRKVLNSMPLAGHSDDLERFFPSYTPQLGSLALGSQGSGLLSDLSAAQARLDSNNTVYGRARLAVYSQDQGQQKSCCYCGMCFIGCPWGSIFCTAPHIKALAEKQKIRYWDGVVATKVDEDDKGVTVDLRCMKTGESSQQHFDAIFVAGGPINSTRLLLASKQLYDYPVKLKESQKFVLPLLRMRDAPQALNEKKNDLAAVFYLTKFPALSPHWIHLQMTPLSDLVLRQLKLQQGQRYHAMSGMLSPFLRRLIPCWVAMHSNHSSHVKLTLRSTTRNQLNVLEIDTEISKPSRKLARAVAYQLFKQGLSFRSAFLFPLLKFSNPGSGTHCGGSFPMRASPQALLDSDIYGRPFGWKKIFVVDSSVLPSMPATTTAFNVMANSMRIATEGPIAS